MVTLTGGSRSTVRLSPLRVGVRDLPSSTVLAGFLYGQADPTSVPPGLRPGHAYLNLKTGDVFQLGANMQWSKVGNVRGPKGDPGPGFSDDAMADLQARVAAAIELGLTPSEDLEDVFEDSLDGTSSVPDNNDGTGQPLVDLTTLFENSLQ